MSVLLELVTKGNDVSINLYLEDVSTVQFKADVLSLIETCTDNKVIDQAISLLETLKGEK